MLSANSISVSSTIDATTFPQKAIDLATKLDLPFSKSTELRTTELLLAYTSKGLQLLYMPFNSSKTTCLLWVNFIHGKHGFRLAKNRTIKQPIARAIGIKSGFRPSIFDATAGLGSDAFVLASLGCHVTMCERSPIIKVLLEDGLKRASGNTMTSAIVVNQMHLMQANAKKYLQENGGSYHTIYLDPMYPHQRKSALNKQPLRVIREIVGDDQDGGTLLQIALEKAGNRVVVKRPRLTPPLTDLRPSHVISMKNNRFDVYMTF